MAFLESCPPPKSLPHPSMFFDEEDFLAQRRCDEKISHPSELREPSTVIGRSSEISSTPHTIFTEFLPPPRCEGEPSLPVGVRYCSICGYAVAGDWAVHENGAKHKKAKSRVDGVNQQRRCDVCDVFVSGDANWAVHVTGDRHIRNESTKRRQQEAQKPNTNLPTPAETLIHSSPPASHFRCNLCLTTISGVLNAEQHLKGGMHVRNASKRKHNCFLCGCESVGDVNYIKHMQENHNISLCIPSDLEVTQL